MSDQQEMTVQQLEDAAKAEAAKAKEAADEAAQASTKAAAEKAAKKAVEAAERATKLIELMEERKAQEAEKQALVSAAAPVQDPKKEEAEKKRAKALEMVTIQLFKDEERYKDDMAVFVNGRRVLIKRGVPVQVPRYIAEVVAASQKQDSQTEAMMTRLVEEYEHNTEEKTKPYGG